MYINVLNIGNKENQKIKKLTPKSLPPETATVSFLLVMSVPLFIFCIFEVSKQYVYSICIFYFVKTNIIL